MSIWHLSHTRFQPWKQMQESENTFSYTNAYKSLPVDWPMKVNEAVNWIYYFFKLAPSFISRRVLYIIFSHGQGCRICGLKAWSRNVISCGCTVTLAGGARRVGRWGRAGGGRGLVLAHREHGPRLYLRHAFKLVALIFVWYGLIRLNRGMGMCTSNFFKACFQFK